MKSILVEFRRIVFFSKTYDYGFSALQFFFIIKQLFSPSDWATRQKKNPLHRHAVVRSSMPWKGQLAHLHEYDGFASQCRSRSFCPTPLSPQGAKNSFPAPCSTFCLVIVSSYGKTAAGSTKCLGRWAWNFRACHVPYLCGDEPCTHEGVHLGWSWDFYQAFLAVAHADKDDHFVMGLASCCVWILLFSFSPCFIGSGPMGRVQKYTSTSKYIPGSLYILFVRSAKKK